MWRNKKNKVQSNAAMLNSADDHQTKPNMNYIKYQICQKLNMKKTKIKC